MLCAVLRGGPRVAGHPTSCATTFSRSLSTTAMTGTGSFSQPSQKFTTGGAPLLRTCNPLLAELACRGNSAQLHAALSSVRSFSTTSVSGKSSPVVALEMKEQDGVTILDESVSTSRSSSTLSSSSTASSNTNSKEMSLQLDLTAAAAVVPGPLSANSSGNSSPSRRQFSSTRTSLPSITTSPSLATLPRRREPVQLFDERSNIMFAVAKREFASRAWEKYLPRLRPGGGETRSSSEKEAGSAAPEGNKDGEAPPKNESTIKKMMREYGFPFLIWYNGLWLVTLGILYSLLKLDVIKWEQVLRLVKWLGVEEYIDVDSIDPEKGKMGVALCINPIFEPLRIAFSVATIKPLMRVIGPMIGRVPK